MKIRTNYVSNSSSSSYIVKFKRGNTILIGATYYSIEDVKKLIERLSYGLYDTRIRCRDKEEFCEKIRNDSYLTDIEKDEELKVFEYISDDEELLELDIDYSDETLKKILFSFSELGLFKVISIDGSIIV